MATLVVHFWFMANPQLENGHVKIANDIFDALARIRISGEARQVLDVIIRKTYGFNKKEDAISLSQFSLFTGMGRNDVCRALNKLVSMNLILKKETTIANSYRLNKDFDTWKSLAKKRPQSQKRESGSLKKENNRTQKRDIQKTVTKDTITKDNTDASIGVEKHKFSTMGAEIIKSFESVNPNCKRFYNNPPQRGACDRLIEQYGLERVLKVVAFLPKSNTVSYLPTITTPVQLEEKWVALESGVLKQRSKTISTGKGLA